MKSSRCKRRIKKKERSHSMIKYISLLNQQDLCPFFCPDHGEKKKKTSHGLHACIYFSKQTTTKCKQHAHFFFLCLGVFPKDHWCSTWFILWLTFEWVDDECQPFGFIKGNLCFHGPSEPMKRISLWLGLYFLDQQSIIVDILIEDNQRISDVR